MFGRLVLAISASIRFVPLLLMVMYSWLVDCLKLTAVTVTFALTWIAVVTGASDGLGVDVGVGVGVAVGVGLGLGVTVGVGVGTGDVSGPT